MQVKMYCYHSRELRNEEVQYSNIKYGNSKDELMSTRSWMYMFFSKRQLENKINFSLIPVFY